VPENDMPLVRALAIPRQFLWVFFGAMLAEQSGGVTSAIDRKKAVKSRAEVFFESCR
jgi:hypothetical protein